MSQRISDLPVEGLAPYRERIDKLVEWARQRCPTQKDRITTPTVEWDRKPKAGRIACYTVGQERISINPVYDAKDKEAVLVESLKHEFAHHLDTILFGNHKRAHGRTFKVVCKSLGIPGTSCSQALTGLKKHRRVRAECSPGCGGVSAITYTIVRGIEDGKAYRCKLCKAPIRVSALVIGDGTR